MLNRFFATLLMLIAKPKKKKNGLVIRIKATSFKVIVENENQVEVSFSRPWDPSLKGKLVPLNIDKR